ncbi:hypothetical protein [Lysinibacillus sp. RC79]|uniref:hypothetical protein n=1 Tax=Lysinibacillus sp. RC79 TaxID=3156296 RepID=UPI0035125A9B
MITLDELAQKLKILGYPVAYSHFKSPKTPPFICYLVENSDTFSADNTVLSKSTYVNIELYVANKDLVAEKKIEDMLKENKLPWGYDEIFIIAEGVFKCTFSITLIN